MDWSTRMILIGCDLSYSERKVESDKALSKHERMEGWNLLVNRSWNWPRQSWLISIGGPLHLAEGKKKVVGIASLAKHRSGPKFHQPSDLRAWNWRTEQARRLERCSLSALGVRWFEGRSWKVLGVSDRAPNPKGYIGSWSIEFWTSAFGTWCVAVLRLVSSLDTQTSEGLSSRTKQYNQ